MNAERLKILYQYLEQDPEDPFNRYAIANELASTQPAEALAHYRELLSKHPNYTATYYHAAALLVGMGERDAAEQVYLKGLQICKQTGDTHSLRELQTAYTNFQFEEEED